MRSGTVIVLTNEELLYVHAFLNNVELHVNECPDQTGYPAEKCLDAIRAKWEEYRIPYIQRLIDEALLSTRRERSST